MALRKPESQAQFELAQENIDFAAENKRLRLALAAAEDVLAFYAESKLLHMKLSGAAAQAYFKNKGGK